LDSVAYPGTLPTVAQLQQLSAYEDLESTDQTKFLKVRTAAIAAWQADKVAQSGKVSFDTWVASNYPSYRQAQNDLNNAAAIVDAYARQIYSPAAATLDSQINLLENEAFFPSLSYPG
jgi:hypothetical protein